VAAIHLPPSVWILAPPTSAGDSALCLAISYFSLNYVKFILPTAPMAYISYQNVTTHSWFDIPKLGSIMGNEDEHSLLASVSRIENILQGEVISGVSPHRIFILGFSQGGAVGLTNYLRTKVAIGGFIGISTWLPRTQDYPSALSSATKDSLVSLQHVRLRRSMTT
jgi:phospholipase/carboxylesterase